MSFVDAPSEPISQPLHVPVLLKETIELLAPRPGEIFVDCTLGRGGHSQALLQAVGPTGRGVGFDLDPVNLAYAESRLQEKDRFAAVHASFLRMPERLQKMGLRADIVLADLGFSSNQMDDPARGFSFSADGPLDMRLNPQGAVSAADLLAVLSERELADLIYRFGEEPLARKIAQKLAQTRRQQPIRTTAELARLVHEAYGSRARTSRMHPATRTFMALRIAVNDELGALSGLLDHIVQGAGQAGRGGWMNAGARVAIIGFHSLEDRLVKRTFATLCEQGLATGITRKPVGPSESETAVNPRARSARLRVVRIGGTQPQAG